MSSSSRKLVGMYLLKIFAISRFVYLPVRPAFLLCLTFCLVCVPRALVFASVCVPCSVYGPRAPVSVYVCLLTSCSCFLLGLSTFLALLSAVLSPSHMYAPAPIVLSSLSFRIQSFPLRALPSSIRKSPILLVSYITCCLSINTGRSASVFTSPAHSIVSFLPTVINYEPHSTISANQLVSRDPRKTLKLIVRYRCFTGDGTSPHIINVFPSDWGCRKKTYCCFV